MERELAKTAEDIVCVKGNEVGFGCYRNAQPVPRHNKVLALTTASLSPLSHATPDSLSPSLCATAASLSPSPYASAASRSPSPLLSHYCCVTLYCLTIAASLCIVSLPLSHYRCLTAAVLLSLSHYRCLTTAVSLALSHYRCLTIAASVFIDLLPLSHCLLPAATAKKPRSTTTPSVSPHTCT